MKVIAEAGPPIGAILKFMDGPSGKKWKVTAITDRGYQLTPHNFQPHPSNPILQEKIRTKSDVIKFWRPA